MTCSAVLSENSLVRTSVEDEVPSSWNHCLKGDNQRIGFWAGFRGLLKIGTAPGLKSLPRRKIPGPCAASGLFSAALQT